jgi:DNA-directed RNA polymerase subunit RPC12/RpoP
MGALLKCQDCGYVISSAENIELAKNIAERTNQCQKCHSKRFVVSKQPEKNVVVESEQDDQNGDSEQTTLDDH